MAAVLEIFDVAARWSSHELGLVAVADPGYSSKTGQATFPLPLGPMERLDASDCGFELLGEETTLILLHQRMKGHQMNCPFFLRPSE
jgi:hypothetical protein